MSTGESSAADVVDRLRSGSAFALLRRWDADAGAPGPVEVLIGRIDTVEDLADIPLPAGVPDLDHDALALVPFRQIRERGYDCHDDGTPLQVLRVEESHRLEVGEALHALPDEDVALDETGFDVDDETYEAIVERIAHDEIATGEGANFVIRRDFTGRLRTCGTGTALALFRRLLQAERGAYWTFLVRTGERTLVGASPEVHVRMDRDEVVLNPISGTYRYPSSGPDVEELLTFLDDAKERSELAMVLDEELKMMAAVGDGGARVHGPRLREMAHLAHTEFEIRGRTAADARAVLRETLFAATVTGSPLENACRVIRRHERSGRGYYAGALALFSRDAAGRQQLDSPILIRAADIAPDGTFRVGVGATLVRDSDPRSEVAETWTKAAGVLTALGAREPNPTSAPVPPLARDPRVAERLESRRGALSQFWLHPRGERPAATGRALVIDGGDAFTAMLAQVLRALGLEPDVHRHDDPALEDLLAAAPGLVVLGPGPGDPADPADPRMARLRAAADGLVRRAADGRPVLGVCLGHQLLGQALGLTASRRPRPHQGQQEQSDVFGRRSVVGFYNSFALHADAAAVDRLRARGVEVSGDGTEVHAFRSAHVAGLQFHPESVLTLDGPALVRDALAHLVPQHIAPARSPEQETLPANSARSA